MKTKKPAVQKKTRRLEPPAREYAGRNVPEEERRSARLQVRLRDEELELFRQAALAEADVDVSSWARRVLIRNAKATIERSK